MIPMVDLKTQNLNLKDEIDLAMQEALRSCAFVLGPCAQAFERESAACLGAEHAVGCASGADARARGLRTSGRPPFATATPADRA